VGTFELPRVQADPALTRKVVAGPVTVLGGDAGCSDGATAADRWCAFTVRSAAGSDELWVMNATRALAGAPIACDGTSDSCLRLTTTLWTGTPIWGPSHPIAHRFAGDTLVFHAGATSAPGEVYAGPVWAWRPGWTAARKLTGDHALLCAPEARSSAVFCLDNAIVERDTGSPFEPPVLRELDLLAGALEPAGAGPLPTVTHLRNVGSDAAWRARFSPDGAYLAFSNLAAPGARETLQVIKTADAGKSAPLVTLEDAAEWEIASDGAKIYVLAGYDRSRGDSATGTLTLADFPSGAHPTLLQSSVLWFQPIGAPGDADRGLLFSYSSGAALTGTAVLRDREHPSDLFLLGTKAHDAQVGPDGRHTVYYQDLRGGDFPVAFVARNDASGSCQLTSDWRAETYGSGFAESGRSVFWIEYFRNESQSEEGWYARPQACDDKKKFGDYVAWYALVGEDFVVFEGGDFDDTTTWLQYTPLKLTAGPPWPPAVVIKEHPDPGVSVVRTSAGTAVLFSVSRGSADEIGLFLHGPLKTPAP
jgi:hypothetical protein